MSYLKDTQEHKRTQGDAIRAMSDEELAEFLIKGKFNCSNVFDCFDVCKDSKKGCAWGCKHKDGNDMEILSEWLKSEVKE